MLGFWDVYGPDFLDRDTFFLCTKPYSTVYLFSLSLVFHFLFMLFISAISYCISTIAFYYYLLLSPVTENRRRVISHRFWRTRCNPTMCLAPRYRKESNHRDSSHHRQRYWSPLHIDNGESSRLDRNQQVNMVVCSRSRIQRWDTEASF